MSVKSPRHAWRVLPVTVALLFCVHHVSAMAVDDSEPVMECFNGGKLVNGVCECGIYYTGDTCAERQCPHSNGGEGQYSILPTNDFKFCDSCNQKYYKGMNCQLCTSDASCSMYGGKGGSCNQQLTILGNEKNIQCSLDSEFFIHAMGDGRDIKAEIMLSCRTDDGKPFADSDSARCGFAIYRIEPHEEYIDPFFRCEARECKMSFGEENSGEEKKESRSQAVLRWCKSIGGWTLISLSLSFSIVGMFAKFIGPKNVRRATGTLTGLIVVSVVIYMVIMIVCMQPQVEEVVVYDCGKTECACAEDPPRQYQPLCSESKILSGILPNIKNGIKLKCSDVSGRCVLTLKDIDLFFQAECHASECLDEGLFPDNQDSTGHPSTKKRQRLLYILASIPILCIIGLISHFLYLRKQSKELAKRFILTFNVDMTAGANTANNLDESAGEGTSLLLGDPRQDDDDDNEEILSPDALLRLSHLTPEQQNELENTRRLTSSEIELTVSDLRYRLEKIRFASSEDSQAKTILHQVNFSIRSGGVLAIMGPSGAGKTTLLDLLAARAKGGTTSGALLLNGVELKGKTLQQYRNIIGYVSQEDTLLPALTVRQTITYAARLKLPAAFSTKLIKQIVEDMIQTLKLERCKDTLIGDGSQLRGISGGEKRRVSIAVELLANPRILFLDEPTSGLDATSAVRVVEAVVRLAKASPLRRYAPQYFAFNPIVIFSIHQPSHEIYRLFDKVLLLSQGMSVYCGQAEGAGGILENRVKHAFGPTRGDIPVMDAHANPAEYLMKLEEALDDSVRAELQSQDIRENIGQIASRQAFATPGGIGAETTRVSGAVILDATATYRVYYANVYQQMALLTSRSFASLLGSFHLIVCHATVTGLLALIMSFLYADQKLDLPGTLNRAGGVTFLLLVTAFVSLSCLELLLAERKLVVVEKENGYYSTFPYLFSKIVVDVLPLRVLPSVVLSCVLYFPMSFRTDSGNHFTWFVLVVASFSVCMTLSIMCIGSVAGSFGAAALISSVFILWNFVFGGLMVQAGTLPSVFKPFETASPFFLSFESLMVNELNGQSCMFSPTDESGKQSDIKIPIMCVQYIANIGLQPQRFSTDILQLLLYCFALVLMAWLLLATFTRIVR
ncbi:ATP-binding protein cassette protein subfamily G, member 5 [Angomonas deanei]|uniref:ABC transporter/ABC-2 type transporter, putative n=1 Tax=Angomonas deanei TaxID=59799 RepID=A0A7G2CLL5_9TRYP|nr:ATP-binding protein cassette protein subfamily G, member 5 [Angomonas deanei]CAD2219152.1 ABC transporter/ABC-2 type transporter, putative [Angomonas deanei]|eukprot:EPY29435.1 ATP-binding protein cassette protein subfamily G, member 5 [Angomonas deanei]